MKICNVVGCEKPSRSKGMCVAHYARAMRHGSPTAPRPVHKRAAKTRGEIERLMGMTTDECIQWPFYRDDKGYGRMWVEGKHRFVHRIVCERLNGPAPTDQHMAAHYCGKGHEGCVNPRHIRWATAKENVEDKKLHGTQLYGVDAPRSKLAERDVIHIRQWLSKGYSQHRLAKIFGVAPSVVNDIATGKSWGWLA